MTGKLAVGEVYPFDLCNLIESEKEGVSMEDIQIH